MFEKIIGNDKIKLELTNSIKLNKILHSYMFIGNSGIGKKMIAKEFAKMILCLDEKKYCGKCKSCIEFDSNNNPDFQIIEPDGTSIKIEQIRQMQRKIIEAPIISNKKVYIINDADLMTVEAQNCLLKTLEEPPKFVTIILIGSNENIFLSTIKSRCNIIKFQNLTDKEIADFLAEKYEIFDLSDNMLKIIQGSIGKAEEVKDKQELYNNIFDIVEKIKKLDFIDILKKADIIYKSQDDKDNILEAINIILYEKGNEDIRFLNCINYVEETKKRINSNANYNMSIDYLLLKIWEEMR